jgi:hypothetical protein
VAEPAAAQELLRRAVLGQRTAGNALERLGNGVERLCTLEWGGNGLLEE